MQTGFPAKSDALVFQNSVVVKDPRSDLEKMRRRALQAELIKRGYPQAKDWTKNDCIRVLQMEPQLGEIRRKLGGGSKTDLEDLDGVGLIALMRRYGMKPEGTESDDEMRLMIRDKMAELDGTLRPHLPNLDSMTRPALMKLAKGMGLPVTNTTTKEELVASIRENDRGNNAAGSNQPASP